MTKAITEKSDRQNSAYSNTSETVSADTMKNRNRKPKAILNW